MPAGVQAALCTIAVAAGAGAPPAVAQMPRSHAAATPGAAAAQTEAGRLLASLPLPAGTTPLSGEPQAAGGSLAASPAPKVQVPLASVTGWWTAPGAPRATIEYVHDRLAELSPFSRSVFPTAIAPGVLRARIRLLEGSGAIAERWLVLTATALPGGLTALRGDVQVLYVRPQDPISARARAIRVTVTRLAGSASSRTFTVTAKRRVKTTARLVDRLRPARPSLLPKPCPATTATVRLGFLSNSHARSALAVATATIGGCGGVELTIRRKPGQPRLQSPALGFAAELERALGRRFPAR